MAEPTIDKLLTFARYFAMIARNGGGAEMHGGGYAWMGEGSKPLRIKSMQENKRP